MDDVKQALVHNQVPKRWRRYYTNKNLIDWTKNLASRINFMRDTLSDLSQVKSYDISAFFNPKKFLNVLTISMLSNYEEVKTLDQVELM